MYTQASVTGSAKNACIKLNYLSTVAVSAMDVVVFGGRSKGFGPSYLLSKERYSRYSLVIASPTVSPHAQMASVLNFSGTT
jgi:hypothetical protein